MQGWKKEADKGVLGTFSTLISAVKSKDWKSIGQWVLSTLYNGLAPESQKLIDDFGLNLIQQLNKALGDKISDISQKAWDIGSSIADGIAKGLGNALGKDGGVQDILNGLNINVSDVAARSWVCWAPWARASAPLSPTRAQISQALPGAWAVWARSQRA